MQTTGIVGFLLSGSQIEPSRQKKHALESVEDIEDLQITLIQKGFSYDFKRHFDTCTGALRQYR